MLLIQIRTTLVNAYAPSFDNPEIIAEWYLVKGTQELLDQVFQERQA